MRLEGCFTALLTPFSGGRLDEPALRRLIRRQISAGVSGLVASGSTGESATLSPLEKRRAVEVCLDESAGRTPVIVGVGTNSTDRSVEEARAAAGLGADALLALVPYYTKPTQEGLIRHFRAVAAASKAPIVLYNIPGRTGVNLLPATIARLAKDCGNIVAVKEASGSLDQVSEILALCPRSFTVLSGDDSLTLPMMAVGAKGVVSVVSNIVPSAVARLCSAALKGDCRSARASHQKLFPLAKALFAETNPIPVKAAAKLLGLCSDELRLPLAPASAQTRRRLALELKRLGLR